jgi:hypothetical protein
LDKEALKLLSLADLSATLRFFDDPVGRGDTAFKPSWQTALSAWNLLQFLPGLEVVATEGLSDVAQLPASPMSTPEDPILSELLLLAAPECHDFVKAWLAAGRVAPEIGLDVLAQGSHRIAATLELAWPEFRVGLVLPEQEDVLEADRKEGWTVKMMPVSVEDIDILLKGETHAASGHIG